MKLEIPNKRYLSPEKINEKPSNFCIKGDGNNTRIGTVAITETINLFLNLASSLCADYDGYDCYCFYEIVLFYDA